MTKTIKNMDIVQYKLKWVVWKKTGQEFVVIFDGKERAVCDYIKNAMENIVFSKSNELKYIDIAPYGTLILTGKNDIKKKIDITGVGFFFNKERAANDIFYSFELSYIIKNMIKKSGYKKRLVITNDLFKKLSRHKRNGKIGQVKE